MQHTRIAVCAFLAALLSAPVLKADMIELKNGAVFEGKIVHQSDESVTIRMMGAGSNDEDGPTIEMSFKRERIKSITISEGLLTPARRPKAVDVTREAPPPAAPEAKPDTESPDLFGQEGGGTPATKQPPATGGEAAPEAEEEEEINPLILRYMEDLGDLDQKTRDAARTRLAAFGTDATPALVPAYRESTSYTMKRSILIVLSDIKDKRATRFLIDALEGTGREESRMEWAWIALKKTTGQNIYFDADDSARARGSQRQRWLDWFETVKEDDAYAEQIGYEEEAADTAAGEPSQPADAAPAEAEPDTPTEPEVTGDDW